MTSIVLIAGVALILCVIAWVWRRDEDQDMDMRSTYQWEHDLGCYIDDHSAWRHEYIGLDQRITLDEFIRLANSSGKFIP